MGEKALLAAKVKGAFSALLALALFASCPVSADSEATLELPPEIAAACAQGGGCVLVTREVLEMIFKRCGRSA